MTPALIVLALSGTLAAAPAAPAPLTLTMPASTADHCRLSLLDSRHHILQTTTLPAGLMPSTLSIPVRAAAPAHPRETLRLRCASFVEERAVPSRITVRLAQVRSVQRARFETLPASA